jgi:hypothetical protein
MDGAAVETVMTRASCPSCQSIVSAVRLSQSEFSRFLRAMSAA